MARQKLLLLDFDGTICLGDDPIRHYAEQVDAMLTTQSSPNDQLNPSISSIVSDALATNSLTVSQLRDTNNGSSPQSAHDGYQLVQQLAKRAGLTDEDINRAFHQARTAMLSAGLDSTDVHSPAGTPGILDAARSTAVVALITNSPAEGFNLWLEQLGLIDAFDIVINDAAKPTGMPAAQHRARQAASENSTSSIADHDILSIGDIWRNDLAHVHSIGGTTVLIDRFSTGLGEPTKRVRDSVDAVRFISEWAR